MKTAAFESGAQNLDIETKANEAHINLFNQHADAIRSSLGIDADRCLRLVGIPGSDFPSMHEYFSGLVAKEFRTPLVGKNRRHDLWHEPQIANSHPDFVDVLVTAALDGAQFLANGEVDAAEATMFRIETLLSAPVVTPRVLTLAAQFSLQHGIVGDPTLVADQLSEKQNQYAANFASAEKSLQD